MQKTIEERKQPTESKPAEQAAEQEVEQVSLSPEERAAAVQARALWSQAIANALAAISTDLSFHKIQHLVFNRTEDGIVVNAIPFGYKGEQPIETAEPTEQPTTDAE
jgi:hypothetical protein